MSDVIIRVEGVGKKYRLRHERRSDYTALRDVISEKVKSAFRLQMRSGPGSQRASAAHSVMEDFWALKDVSFEINRGEVVGIIGRNGAGKSTLLKILSRITEPTEGRVELYGHAASLLEVGTGFHPELTGGENIYLNGAILGMRRADIRRKFDEIVAFAEVEKFIDTPVKRYSSGMYVRLAFAVAAHLEPEILVVDEVLAVGDADFQKKCLGKMHDVAEQEGRTVLFVSHNMGAIKRLTRRCLLLGEGRLTADAAAQDVIDLYLKHASRGLEGGVFVRDPAAIKGRPFYVLRVTTRTNSNGEPACQFDCDEAVLICIEYSATRKISGLYGYITLQRLDGTVVYEGDSRDGGDNPLDNLRAGGGTLTVTVPRRVLGPGSYQIYLSFASATDPAGPDVDSPQIVGEFSLDDTSTIRGNSRNGYLSSIFDWEISESASAPGAVNR